MTPNPGLPPALSKAHQVERDERTDHLKADIDQILTEIDDVIGEAEQGGPTRSSAA